MGTPDFYILNVRARRCDLPGQVNHEQATRRGEAARRRQGGEQDRVSRGRAQVLEAAAVHVQCWKLDPDACPELIRGDRQAENIASQRAKGGTGRVRGDGRTVLAPAQVGQAVGSRTRQRCRFVADQLTVNIAQRAVCVRIRLADRNQRAGRLGQVHGQRVSRIRVRSGRERAGQDALSRGCGDLPLVGVGTAVAADPDLASAPVPDAGGQQPERRRVAGQLRRRHEHDWRIGVGRRFVVVRRVPKRGTDVELGRLGGADHHLFAGELQIAVLILLDAGNAHQRIFYAKRRIGERDQVHRLQHAKQQREVPGVDVARRLEALQSELRTGLCNQRVADFDMLLR